MMCSWNTHGLNAERTMKSRFIGIASLKEDLKTTEYIREA